MGKEPLLCLFLVSESLLAVSFGEKRSGMTLSRLEGPCERSGIESQLCCVQGKRPANFAIGPERAKLPKRNPELLRTYSSSKIGCRIRGSSGRTRQTPVCIPA